MPDDSTLPASLAAVGIRDTRLITRAIRQRWPIPADKRAALIGRQVEIATSKTVSPRESTAAFKSVLAAEAQNISTENRPLRKLKPQPINRDTIIVVGDLAESKRRAIAYAKQIGLIRDDSTGDA